MIHRLKGLILRLMAVRQNVHVGAAFHVGPRSTIWAPRSLTIGDHVYVGKNVTIEVDGTIGDEVLIANGVGIIGRRDHDITQEGSGVRSSDWVGDLPEALSMPIHIGSDVWLGYGAIVLSGVRIGDSSVIAAGSVVSRDIPPNSVALGNPARVVRARFDADALVRHWSELRAKGIRITDFEQS